MLPSMPCLNLPDRSNAMGLLEEHFNNVCDEQEAKPKPNGAFEECKNNVALPESLNVMSTENMNINVSTSSTSQIIEVCDKDSVDEINALMMASSTIKNVREKKELSSIADKKKAKRRKEYLVSLAMLSPPDPSTKRDKTDQLAQAYSEKLKETLDITDYDKLVYLFENIDRELQNPLELHTKMKPILNSKCPDLADEFLLFLNAEQANGLGKLIPFLIINHMTKFLRNLEVYFKDQPSQLRKIYKSLIDLDETTNITLEKVKTAILPLLRGNPLLCDSFLQIFLEESPPSTLFNDACEMIEVNKELNKADDEAVFESITVSDSEDSTCLCSCHKIDEQQPMKQHCITCGLRFVQGKVCCQTARGLKSVNVTFPFDLDIDHNVRLGVQTRIKRFDYSHSRAVNSPSKDNQDEHLAYKEIEEYDKGKNIKGCRSPKKSKSKPKKLCVIPKNKDYISKSIKRTPKKLTGNLCRNKSQNIYKSCSALIHKPDICSKQIENLVDVIGRKNLPPPEYLDLHSSDSEFKWMNSISSCLRCKTKECDRLKLYNDISQDERSDLNRKKNSSFTKNESKWVMWSRDEDKIILQTFQQKFNEEAIQLIAKQLKNRSTDEIRSRFEILMMLLQEMEST